MVSLQEHSELVAGLAIFCPDGTFLPRKFNLLLTKLLLYCVRHPETHVKRCGALQGLQLSGRRNKESAHGWKIFLMTGYLLSRVI